MSNLDPAATIIARIGGPGVAASVTGVHRTRVWNWTRPKAKGGTGGLIPHWHHQRLLDFAAKNAIELTAEDFVQRAGASGS